jgi:hypothetical protein
MRMALSYPRFGNDAWGKRVLGDIDFDGVQWRAYAAGWHEWVSRDEITPDKVSVEQNPRCPRCQTELEERARFWGGFEWSCCQCDFRINSKSTFGAASMRAAKVARSGWEAELRKPASKFQGEVGGRSR